MDSWISTVFGGMAPFARLALGLLAALAVGHVAGTLLRRLLQRLVRESDVPSDDLILKHGSWPLRVLLTSALLLFATRALATASELDPELVALLRQLVGIALIVSVTWLLIAAAQMLEAVLLRRYDMNVADNLTARRVITQVRMIKRIVIAVVLVIGMACLLMTFDRVRQLGASLLASAGIAGVILGFAAQRSLATLIAGLQIAFTQPIRIEDVVIVEGEWGKIEEITLSYVVVRIWDQRRLVVPITHFIEKPFQNWTRVSADILGTVFLYVDYGVPVDALRERLRQIVEESDLWDGKVCGMQVTDATERSLQLRALVSASDSSKAWDLRCLVREKLIEFLRAEYPESLPRARVEIANDPDLAPATASAPSTGSPTTPDSR